MVLVVHVIIALSSVAWSFFTYLAPSSRKLSASAVLISATLISGTILVLDSHAALVKSCFTGLIFVAISIAGVVSAKQKLAKISNTRD